MENKNHEFLGLTSDEVVKRQQFYGKNELCIEKKQSFFFKFLHTICEPMFLLLLVASIIYFILGEPRDGIIMLVFVIGIISINLIQSWKTDKTLSALKDLSSPLSKVFRDGELKNLSSKDLVPGDVVSIVEGDKLPADGFVMKASDFCVNESTLTGEALGVWKVVNEKEKNGKYWRKDYCYAGTIVIQGSGLIEIEKIGTSTEYGKIGKNVISAPQEDTPLQNKLEV